MLEWVPALCSLKENILLWNYCPPCNHLFLSCCNLPSAVTAQWSPWTIFVPFWSSLFLSEDVFWDLQEKKWKSWYFHQTFHLYLELLGQSPSTSWNQRREKNWAGNTNYILHINIWMIWHEKKCFLASKTLLGGSVTLKVDIFWHTEVEQITLAFGMFASTSLLCYSLISSVKKCNLGKIAFSRAFISRIYKSSS